MQESYSWWWQRQKRMTRKQIQDMIHNMQKTWIINEKSKKYHEKDEMEAENILRQLTEK